MKGDYKFDVFSPRVFISCFNKADYVVTNTFHGVMFTLIFEKQAVFNSCGKEKVKDVMNEYGLNDSDYSENMAIPDPSIFLSTQTNGTQDISRGEGKGCHVS